MNQLNQWVSAGFNLGYKKTGQPYFGAQNQPISLDKISRRSEDLDKAQIGQSFKSMTGDGAIKASAVLTAPKSARLSGDVWCCNLLVMTNSLLLKMAHRNSWFAHSKGGFSIAMLVYQRVTYWCVLNAGNGWVADPFHH